MKTLTIKIEDGVVTVDSADCPTFKVQFEGISDDTIYYTLIGLLSMEIPKFYKEVSEHPEAWKEE